MAKDDDLVGVVSMDDAIALKIQEIRSHTSYAIEPVKRGNYAILLRKCPKDRMERIVENLLTNAESDCRVGFAMLKYLIGEAQPVNTSPRAQLEELRAMIDAKLVEVVTQVPDVQSEE
jgi:hypothetical protein